MKTKPLRSVGSGNPRTLGTKVFAADLQPDTGFRCRLLDRHFGKVAAAVAAQFGLTGRRPTNSLIHGREEVHKLGFTADASIDRGYQAEVSATSGGATI
jgi:hypothetical protein